MAFAGPLVGLLHRWTHRYKAIQILGLATKILGVRIMINGDKTTDHTATMVLCHV
jgi:hypothetical protein